MAAKQTWYNGCILSEISILKLFSERFSAFGKNPGIDKNNRFAQGAVGALCQPPDAMRKEAGAMVTYSDLIQFVIMLCAVITLVVYVTRKKQRPRPSKIRRCFL